ncbi:MAG: transposase [Microcoleus sp. PH2017_40_RAT_O_B]|uniref:IS110 family transposase n=1 Tax=unclassified Microcoleus TaxID=2642155 RepID=UPI001D930949|nr:MULTISPECIES: transposase [unclassified Microcoleus]MCC3575259.1 transposase [Microcoleus sp. PH2017_34_RAT_O_A]MCC3612836.1 transposase [Microcoleus sp. PH2017_40_RAT_O_B]
MRVLGIDICKSSVVCCLLEQRPQEPRESYYSVEFLTLRADAAGIKQLLELRPDVAVMEPTGINYQRLWGTHLARSGVKVCLVANNKLPPYRSLLDLPDKDDEADALALACYYFDYQHLPRRFLQVRDSNIVRMRELCLRLAHYNRLQSPIINRLRQDLAWQFPEVMAIKSEMNAYGDLPLLWGWMAGLRKSAKYDRIYSATVGTGLSQETKFAAKMLCDLQVQDRVVQLELFHLVTGDVRFLPYRKVFARFGFGLRVQSLILSQIYPIENYFGDDGKPEIVIRKGRNSKKPTRRYLSERRFMKSLGLAPTREWSGDEKKKSRKSGSDICRTAFWQWVFTRIECGRSRLRNEIGDKLSVYLLEAKAQKQSVKLVRSRVAAKAARMLWRELVLEIFINPENYLE